jgi:AcrR family transcriptional regulator
VRTRKLIVRVAKKLLLESGALEFSQRAVAQRAGISVSNLQYYFPTRLAVLRAVVEPEIDAYLSELKRALESGASPRETLDALLGMALENVKDVKGTALWAHFVSFASIDPECARLIDEWYASLTQAIAALVCALNPSLKGADGEHVAMLLVAMADGLALQYTMGRQTAGLDARFLATVYSLVEGKVPGGKSR